MKKVYIALLAISSFCTAAAAQSGTAVSQLLSSGQAEVAVPQAPLQDRGAVLDHLIGWDEAAPLNYAQAPAAVVPGAAGVVVISNVRLGRTPADHKSYNWDTLTVKPELLEKVLYAYKTAGTGHTFLVFTFKEGGAVNARGESVRALTFGAEGWSREPKGYNIAHALAGKYPLLWLVTSFESYADYAVNYKKMDVFLRNIAIGRQETLRLFETLLARINETNRNKETYDLFNNSCTNNPVNLLNGVLPKSKRISLEVAGLMNPDASIPKYAVKKYTENGVLLPQVWSVGTANYGTFDITAI